VKALHRVVAAHLGLALLAGLGLSAAQSKQTFTGTVTDDMCPRADHSQMRMGPTDAECSAACIREHGAVYVLFDGDSAYTLSDQKTAAKFAAQKVKVTGTLDTKTHTIHVDSITAAK
jgi:type 1 fimbria pilin